MFDFEKPNKDRDVHVIRTTSTVQAILIDQPEGKEVEKGRSSERLDGAKPTREKRGKSEVGKKASRIGKKGR